MDKDDVSGRIKRIRVETLYGDRFALRRATYDYLRRDGAWQTQIREAYDIGDGAAVLPVDRARGIVLLIRQFRWATYEWGYRQNLIETIAGKLDDDDPQSCVVREAMEEAGVRIVHPRLVFHCFTSPGRVEERLSLFVADYDSTAPREAGGGLEHEGEDIEVLEVTLGGALAMIERGEIVDAKTIMLLQYVALERLQSPPSP
jgi:nudix-type nucleoside diphosphatase (YffH/AdpP family)